MVSQSLATALREKAARLIVLAVGQNTPVSGQTPNRAGPSLLCVSAGGINLDYLRVVFPRKRVDRLYAVLLESNNDVNTAAAKLQQGNHILLRSAGLVVAVAGG